MIKLVVLYGQPTDAGAFERHYLGTHVPLGDKVPGLQCAEFARAVATLDGSPPPYYRVADVYFDSLEQLRAAFASPEGQALAADAANFVTGGATVLVCEIDAKRTGARGAAGAGGAGRPG
jgi:uncharacterized protein (TIGR02118 family)